MYVVPDHFTLNGKKHASLTLCCANSNPTQKANGVLFKQARVTQTVHWAHSCIFTDFCLISHGPPRYSKFNSKIKKLLAEIARGFAEICWFIQKMTLKWHYFITKFAPFLEKSSLARTQHNINSIICENCITKSEYNVFSFRYPQKADQICPYNF